RAPRGRKSSKIPVNRLRLQSFAPIRARRRPGFTRKFQAFLSIYLKRPFFSGALCHIVATPKAASRKEDTSNGSRPLRPRLDGNRIDEAFLPPDFPGADAGVPRAVRADHDRTLQADRRGLFRQPRPQRADL